MEYIFYANTSLIAWVLFVPYIVFVVDFQAFYIILLAVILQIIGHKEYIKGLDFEKSQPEFTKEHWLRNPFQYNIRRVAAKSYLFGIATLPAIASHIVVSALSDILYSAEISLHEKAAQVFLMTLVFLLSFISYKVLNIVTKIISLPIVLYSAILIVFVLVGSILSNFQVLPVETYAVDIMNLSFWKWFVFAYFFINSMNTVMVFDRSEKILKNNTSKFTLAHSVSRAALCVLALIAFLYSYTWISGGSTNRIAFEEVNGFEIIGWSAENGQIGFSFLFMSLLIIMASVYLTLPQYLVNRSNENLCEKFFHKGVSIPNNYSKILVFIMTLVYIFVPFNILVIIGASSVITTYAVFFLYMLFRRQELLLRIWYSVLFLMHLLLIMVISWGRHFWILPIMLSLYYVSRYSGFLLKNSKRFWDALAQNYNKTSEQIRYNKDVTLSQLVTTQTIVVFFIIFIIALGSWIFPRGFQQDLQPIFWDLSLTVILLIYYIAIIIIAFLTIPKIENYERVKDSLELSNKNLIKDIKKRKSIEKDLIYTSTHDSLTAAYSRDFIIKKIIHNIQSGVNFDIVFVDIDKFKQINDLHGHSTGDALLKLICKEIIDIFGSNAKISRYGGDEFMIIVRGLSRRTVMQKSQKLVNSFRKSISYRNKKIDVGVSLGIFHYRGQDISINTILKNVDFALRYAKTNELEKCVEYNEEIDKIYEEHLSIEEDIRNRLRTGDFDPFYQPIIDYKQKTVVGFEQLLRIKQGGKYVLPRHYISIAEESGQIEALGWVVMEKACKQLNMFKQEGLPQVYVSVNISSNQFIRANFIKKLKALCDKYNVSPTNLRLEITESILLEDSEEVRGIMNELTWNNFSLYLDDFGTGFSNMSYLKKLPIDTLKIDQSFMGDADDANRAVVRAIASLAKELSINLIAEGVETVEQQKFLENLNIVVMQGYLYSRPIPGDTMVDYYRNFKYT